MIQKHLWLLSKSKAGVLLILLSFAAFTIGERLNFSLSESKDVLFSLQIEAPEVNRMDLGEDSALSAHGKHLKENHLGCLERLGESLVLGTGPHGAWATVSLGQDSIGFQVHTVPPTLPGHNIGAYR